MGSTGPRLFSYLKIDYDIIISEQFGGHMNQRLEEAGMERLCVHCGSWKITPFNPDYYICHSEKCGGRLLEPVEVLSKEINREFRLLSFPLAN